MKESNEANTCLQCGDKLRGRTDKKYCDDSCRNAYFNTRKQAEGEAVGKVIHALKRNRKVLIGILGAYKTRKISHSQLIQAGFNFQYHTHVFGKYVFCFDHGYKYVGPLELLIVKANSYVDTMSCQ